MPERFVITAEQDGERVDKALASLMPAASRASIQRWIAEDRVTLNGGSCKARARLVAGDVVVVAPGPPPPSRALPEPEVPVDIVYEDKDLAVVNKPAGLVVHPGRGHATGTLVNGLLALPGFGQAPPDPRDPEGALRPGIVHRLDKDTSGLLVVAKTPFAREGLKRQLAEHSMHRVYSAITLGVPQERRLVTLHARHPHARLKFTSRAGRGREAVTSVALVERLCSGAAALVECRLETGRTHQIRVHLAEQLNCPILGDTLYGRRAVAPSLLTAEQQLGRQALHAGELGFVHPRTQETHRFKAAWPSDFQQALTTLRTAGSSPGSVRDRADL